MRIVGLLCLGSLLCTPATLPAQDPDARFATPEAVFATCAKSIGQKVDGKAFYSCFEQRSRDMLVGSLVLGTTGVMTAARTGQLPSREQEQAKKLIEVAKRHGVKAGSMSQLTQLSGSKNENLTHGQLSALARPITRKDAFVADVLPFFSRRYRAGFAGKLSDVKIEGETARGSVAVRQGNRNRKAPIDFVRTQGQWRIKMDFGKRK